MPLEATMMIIDNSEYMRNGDYPPTRFDAQSDAVNVVFQTKTDSNPENSVGLMTMAGKGPEVLITHTRDLGQILQAVHSASRNISGSTDLPTAVNVAQLALKHRQNKNLRQRIVIFVGSPLSGQGIDDKSMAKLAKKLKKNNIAVDVVCFGDGIEEGDTPVLKSLVDGANSGDNSHLVSAPPDSLRLLSDVVISSPVLAAERGASIPDAVMADITNTGDGPSGAGDFGVDPNTDPELAMALRMSLEEEEARRAAERVTSAAPTLEPIPESSASSQSAPAPVPPVSSATSPADATNAEEEALKQAIALSKASGEDVEMHDSDKDLGPKTPLDEEVADMDEDMSEEEAIARAIAMSMRPDEGEE